MTIPAEHPYGTCLCLASRRLARVLTQAYDRALSAEGLKITQFSVMAALDYRQGKPTPLAAVADALDIEPSSLTRALGPLVRDGLVEVSHGEDRRQRFGRLTGAGREKLAAAQARWSKVQQQARACLGADEMQALTEHLNESRRRLQELESTAMPLTDGDVK